MGRLVNGPITGEPMADGTRTIPKNKYGTHVFNMAIALACASLVHIGIHFFIAGGTTSPGLTEPISRTSTNVACTLAKQNSAAFDHIINDQHKRVLEFITKDLAIHAPESVVYLSPEYDPNMSDIRDAIVEKLVADGFDASTSWMGVYKRAILVDLTDLYDK